MPVGIEDPVGQADDRVQVKVAQQSLFDPRLDAFAKERAVGENHGSAASGFEQADNER
jgi:hypothetical protein